MNLITYQNAIINLEQIVTARRTGETLHLTLSNGESFEIEGADMKRILFILEKSVIVDLNHAEEYFANLTGDSEIVEKVLRLVLELQDQKPLFVKTIAARVNESPKRIGTILRKALHMRLVRRGKGTVLKIAPGQLEQLRQEFGLP